MLHVLKLRRSGAPDQPTMTPCLCSRCALAMRGAAGHELWQKCGVVEAWGAQVRLLKAIGSVISVATIPIGIVMALTPMGNGVLHVL